MTHEPKPVAMSIMAHPDDAEFSSTGTLLTWINEGYDAYICVITDASAGGSRLSTDLSPAARQVTVDTRKAEQLESARRLGLKGVIHLGLPRWATLPHLATAQRLGARVAHLQPSRVICQSPRAFLGTPFGDCPLPSRPYRCWGSHVARRSTQPHKTRGTSPS
jgi:LmbE family N-acetylglucosaminyl deacetylase